MISQLFSHWLFWTGPHYSHWVDVIYTKVGTWSSILRNLIHKSVNEQFLLYLFIIHTVLYYRDHKGLGFLAPKYHPKTCIYFVASYSVFLTFQTISISFSVLNRSAIPHSSASLGRLTSVTLDLQYKNLLVYSQDTIKWITFYCSPLFLWLYHQHPIELPVVCVSSMTRFKNTIKHLFFFIFYFFYL